MKKFLLCTILALNIRVIAQDAENSQYPFSETVNVASNTAITKEPSTNELLQKIVDTGDSQKLYEFIVHDPENLKALYQMAPEAIEKFVLQQKIDEEKAKANADFLKERAFRLADLLKHENEKKAESAQLVEDTKAWSIAFKEKRKKEIFAELERGCGPLLDAKANEMALAKKHNAQESHWKAITIGACVLTGAMKVAEKYIAPVIAKALKPS
ncbi:MAG: hypothetical protein WCE21_03430 [Candidatus Babeliales bacterium]